MWDEHNYRDAEFMPNEIAEDEEAAAAISDERLLDFAGDHVFDYTEAKARAILAGPQRELYRHHLLLAQFLEGWAGDILTKLGDEKHGDWTQFRNALVEVSAFLRQGSYLPGGCQFKTILAHAPTKPDGP